MPSIGAACRPRGASGASPMTASSIRWMRSATGTVSTAAAASISSRPCCRKPRAAAGRPRPAGGLRRLARGLVPGRAEDHGPGGAGLLSFGGRGYTLALDFPARPGIDDLLRRLERLVLDHGGRIYLAKDSRLTRGGLRRHVPAPAASFAASWRRSIRPAGCARTWRAGSRSGVISDAGGAQCPSRPLARPRRQLLRRPRLRRLAAAGGGGARSSPGATWPIWSGPPPMPGCAAPPGSRCGVSTPPMGPSHAAFVAALPDRPPQRPPGLRPAAAAGGDRP